MDAMNGLNDAARDRADRISKLSPAKLDLLARRLKEKGGKVERPQAIPRRPEPRDIAPLSLAQERLWFVEQLYPGLPIHTLTGMFPFKGYMNLEALTQAVSEVVRRHDAFRTLFPIINGQGHQAIAPARRMRLPIVDLGALAEEERRAQAYRLVKQDKTRAFDLTRDAPLRTRLLMLARDEVVTLWSVHHIVFDDWSVNLFKGETEKLYWDMSDGAAISLAELPIQYGDFALWQRNYLQGEIITSQLSYWRGQLRDNSPLEMPTDHPRAGQLFRGGTRSIILDRYLADRLVGLSQSAGATLFMTMLAAFKALLYRYTGQPDISIGAVISNRNRSEVEKLIGFFLNTLVFRAQVEGTLTGRELIAIVRQVTLEAYAHADVPFESLIDELQPRRDSGAAPMFRVWFDLERAYTSAIAGESSEMQAQAVQEIGSFRWEAVRSASAEVRKNGNGLQWTDHDMGLILKERDDGLHAQMWYNSNLFHATTIGRLLEHFRVLAQAIVDDPDRRIGLLPLLTAAERHQLLQEWNDTDAAFGTGAFLTASFEAWVERTPDAVAVVGNGGHVSYRELSRLANLLSCHLSEIGARRDDCVAVVARRGAELLAVVLAMIKAGVAYLPLNPDDPAKRRHQVLAQSEARVVLTTDEFISEMERVLEAFGQEDRPRLHSIEALMLDGAECESSPRVISKGLSYVMYTSGSTGVPKGVMIEHAGMLNHLRGKVSDLRLTETDVIAQNASQTFDISIWQSLAALLAGGVVVVVGDEAALEPVSLIEEVERERVSILETVPSMLRAILGLLEEIRVEARPKLRNLRWLISNAEALEPELCQRWFKLYPHTKMLNTWGATECSDDVSHLPMDNPPPAGPRYVPLGRPIGNIRIYIVDDLMNETPVGVKGELCIAGVSVGRGYLGDREKTAAAFAPDPFSAGPGARFYRTGDVGRYLPDGGIEFVGRKDDQAKIRGFRVEPSEVEIVLRNHPSVAQAVVIARDDDAGEKRLVAYLTSDLEPGPGFNELRDSMLEQLPDHMVPTAFVRLDVFPLNANGKIDRRNLPAPDHSAVAAAEQWVAPESLFEKRLAQIWSEILNVEQIGIYDNFFSLGGHSIMAIRVINRINQAFSVSLSVRNVFEEPTIAGLALLVEEAMIGELEREPD